jgi:hypothetical protein
MEPPRACLPSLLLSLLLGVSAIPGVRAQTGARALIQTRGTLLRAGVMGGGARMRLERAQGGDTPVLSFQSSRGPVRLLLDTGAATTMVTGELAGRLGLTARPLAPEEFSMAGGGADCPTMPLSRTEVPALELAGRGGGGPGLRLEGLEALVIPGAALPPKVDGVLGASALRQRPVLVDPVEQIVAIGEPALQWRRRLRSPSKVVALSWRRGVPLLPLRIQPGAGGPPETLLALADTGAEGMFLTPALARRLTPLQAPQPARLVGVCGLQEVSRQPLFGIAIGAEGPARESVDAILLANPVFALLEVEAIVGQELLRGRRQLWRLEANPPRLEIW